MKFMYEVVDLLPLSFDHSVSNSSISILCIFLTHFLTYWFMIYSRIVTAILLYVNIKIACF